MPELPEMETYKRLLTPLLAGRPITGVVIQREKSINVPAGQFEEQVLGRTVVAIERRAKHLLFVLDTERVLLLHLMLGGWMHWGTAEEKPERTVQVRLSFGEQHLSFIGLRLGYLHLLSREEAEEKLAKLGPEPMAVSFTPEQFAERAAERRGQLKAALVDQSFLSGIGNCYSDEICFEAGLLPSTSLGELDGSGYDRLYRGMRTILTEAIASGGYMESPLYAGDRLTGGYNSRCRVYDEEGKPCMRCGHPIERVDVASRKSFCCLHCQHGGGRS
ncbi:DNA-formamidopyrimidine glycosylase [Paenibacillus sp. J31TS4]|uniref:Fpg/Nei family DNA glycosylase n=1 Tax=Paenibacillus sp. J31TS4 TaxID=2807195 RepID=UPI001B12A7EF|nr:DNA-formamidopyrimidine glycosylase family protein [Paenibacillus sp. J31TS4]GIP37307.1 DNA-formamidopyrimidine glycosylase [Paenibacillus sp. J31TS4]